MTINYNNKEYSYFYLPCFVDYPKYVLDEIRIWIYFPTFNNENKEIMNLKNPEYYLQLFRNPKPIVLDGVCRELITRFRNGLYRNHIGYVEEQEIKIYERYLFN